MGLYWLADERIGSGKAASFRSWSDALDTVIDMHALITYHVHMSYIRDEAHQIRSGVLL
jgi:hypothetical protein